MELVGWVPLGEPGPDQPGRRFRSGRRNIYTNRFDAIDAAAEGPSAVVAVDEPLVEKD